MKRKFKITSDRSDTITYVHSTEYLERTLSALARQAHPRRPVTILVQDLTHAENVLCPECS